MTAIISTISPEEAADVSAALDAAGYRRPYKIYILGRLHRDTGPGIFRPAGSSGETA